MQVYIRTKNHIFVTCDMFTCGGALPIGVNLKWNIDAPRKVGVSGNKGTEEVDPKLKVGGALRKADVGGTLADGGAMLRSTVTMPFKNFFPSSLALTRSSHYPFLYNTHKHPMTDYPTGTSLNCHAQDSHSGPELDLHVVKLQPRPNFT
jgi:hypothetical protein